MHVGGLLLVAGLSHRLMYGRDCDIANAPQKSVLIIKKLRRYCKSY